MGVILLAGLSSIWHGAVLTGTETRAMTSLAATLVLVPSPSGHIISSLSSSSPSMSNEATIPLTLVRLREWAPGYRSRMGECIRKSIASPLSAAVAQRSVRSGVGWRVEDIRS